MTKKKLMKFTALLLALALVLASLSGCITTGVLAGFAAVEKLREKGAQTKESDETTSGAAESPETETEKPSDAAKEPSSEAGSAETEEETVKPHEEANESFLEFTNRIYGELLASDTLSIHYHVSQPDKYGIDTSEVYWNSLDVSDEALSEYEDTIRLYREELESFDYDSLDWEGKLTYDAFERYLDVEELGFGLDLLYEPLGPNSGQQAMLPLELAEYNFYSEADVRDYIALLELIPEYYEEIMNFEKTKAEAGLFMEDDILENTLDQIREFIDAKDESFLISTFEERLKELDLDDETREALIKENEEAVMNCVYPAYDYLLEELPKYQGQNRYEGGLCNYPDGSEYFEYLLKATVGSDRTPDEMIEMLDEAIDEGINTISMLLRDNYALYDLFENPPFSTTDPNLCLRILQEKILEDYPEIPEVDYSVKYVDASLRDYLSPACYMIPPMDADVKNSILINCDRGSEEDDIFITLAHEGYPGHLYQTNYFKNNAKYMLRDALGTSGFAEGYATYVENNAYNYVDGLSEDGAELLRINAQISLYIYARVDLGLHWEGWTEKDIARYISDYFDGAEDAAKWMYDYMRADPGTYELYAIGELEILDIENEARDADDFDLRAFHKALLDCSEAPFEVIRKNILGS